MINFTPNRITRARVLGGVRPGTRNVLFRPSLVQKATLNRRVGGCSFFSCRAHRTLRLSRSRHRVMVSYLRGVRARLGRDVSGRDHQLVYTGVKLLLSCYVHFCRERFAAQRRMGGSVVIHFRQLLSSCFSDSNPLQRKLPAIGCFTSGIFLSTGCFKSVVHGRAKRATSRCVRGGLVRQTGRTLLNASGAADRVTCKLKFRCPRRLDQVFGQIANCAPGRFHSRG